MKSKNEQPSISVDPVLEFMGTVGRREVVMLIHFIF